MTHLKRQKVPKKWPIPRKGTKFVVRASNLKSGIPILVVLRDILKIAQNRKEVKKAIHEKNILINNKLVIDEKKSVLLFDVMEIVSSKKYYKLELSENGKFKVNEIKENEGLQKVSKIVNKKTLKGKKTQLNLNDGRNFLSEIKCKVNDSVLVNLKDSKIESCLELKENSKAIIFEGKHAGKEGMIKKIEEKKKIAEIEVDTLKGIPKGHDASKKIVNVLIKQFMVVGK